VPANTPVENPALVEGGGGIVAGTAAFRFLAAALQVVLLNRAHALSALPACRMSNTLSARSQPQLLTLA
jgi:hypothetical protein